MAPPAEVQAAELFGCILESMLYGYYISKFVECVRILYHKSRTTKISPTSHITTALLFIFISIHEWFNVYRNYKSFASPAALKKAGYQELYWLSKNTFDTKFRTAVWMVPVYVSDLFMLYRTYVVWGRNLLVILFPFLIFCANVVMGCFWLRAYWFFNVGDSVFLGQFSAFSDSMFAITTAFQVLTASLIAFKLWQHHKNLASANIFSSRSWMRSITVIVESASIYAITLVIILGQALTSTASLFTFLDILPPLIGTVFSMVIIRLSTSTKSMQSTHNGQSISGGSAVNSRAIPRSVRDASGVEIKLDRITHRDPPEHMQDHKYQTSSYSGDQV